MLLVFVYGTLKSGFRNHAICEQYVDRVYPAMVVGAMYRGPGFPYLRVPEKTVIDRGTEDYALDSTRQLVRGAYKQRIFWEAITAAQAAVSMEHWGWVTGEVLVLNTNDSLGVLDRLEGYYPEADHCHYHRVLLPVTQGTEWRPIWGYVMAQNKNRSLPLERIDSGVWTEQ